MDVRKRAEGVRGCNRRVVKARQGEEQVDRNRLELEISQGEVKAGTKGK